ncbi:hypothetical protein V6N12_009093 [Hibiscus sabdariffa]|uniref:Bromo domain-containing protein n=1 Tax=Hibiscus sabdariffa TaxID=183260 RepID=A0ABR2C4N2_9ROSI
MSSGEYRRSPRIIELDARKALARGQNKDNVICEVMDEEEPGKGQDILKQKRRKKKVKVRTVQDLIVNSVEYKVQKTDTGNDQVGLVKNAAIVPSGAAMPEKGKLELLLGILQRKDTHKIFAEPVNAEEVEYYYDVIKEPMDFGTVAKKLNEGSYPTLEEFEHDVSLVFDNAMLFNAANTIYYRQACALKELATKLFLALKTDPGNFETEASVLTMGHGRRKKAGVGILNCKNKSNTSIAARGYRAPRQFNDVDVGRCRTYRPWKSSLSENESVVSAVYNSPKQLQLLELDPFCPYNLCPYLKRNSHGGNHVIHFYMNGEADLGYLESLKRFSKDLGPVAQKVAMKKTERYISEAMRVWNMTTNRQAWAPNMQIPNALITSNIKVAPSVKVPSSTPGCQNISGDKMNVHSGFSHGEQASIDGSMTINNALTGGISQPGGRVESLGNFQGKMIPSASRGFAPALRLLGDSSGYQAFPGKTMDGPSFFWNGGKVSAGYNVDINDALSRGKGKLGDGVDFQEKLLQPMRVGLDSGVAFKDYAANQSNGVHLDSSYPNYESEKAKLDLSALSSTKGKQKELGETSLISNPMNVDNAGHSSSWSRMQECLPQSNTRVSSSSWHPPSVVMTGLNGFQTIDNMTGTGSHYPGKAMCENDVIADGEGSRYRTNVEQGGVVSDLLKPVEMGMQSLSGVGSHYPGKAMCEKEVIADGKGSRYRSNVEEGGLFSDLLKPLETGMQFSTGTGSHYPGKAMCENDVIADGEGSRYRTNVEQGGLVSDLLKPVKMGMQSLSGVGSHYPGKAMFEKVVLGDGKGSRYRSNVEEGGLFSDLLKPLETGMQFSTGTGSHYPGKAMCENDVIADGEGSRYRTNVEQGGVVSDLLKPVKMGMQSLSGVGSHYPGKAMFEKVVLADRKGSRYRSNVEEGGVFSELLKPLEMGMQFSTGIGSRYPGKAMCENDVIADGEGSRYKTNVDQGGVVSHLLKPVEVGMQSLSGVGSHYPGKAMCEKEVIADVNGSRYRTNVEEGGVFSDLLKPLQMGTQFSTGIGSHYPGKAMCEKEVIADGNGYRYRTNVEEGGVFSDLLKPLQMGTQFSTGIGSHYPGKAMCEKDVTAGGEGGVVSDLLKPPEMGMQAPSEFCFQEGILPAELTSLLKEKGELEPLCTVPTDEDWCRFYLENEIRASEKDLEFERFQPESSGTAAERRQKQTVEGTDQAPWNVL